MYFDVISTKLITTLQTDLATCPTQALHLHAKEWEVFQLEQARLTKPSAASTKVVRKEKKKKAKKSVEVPVDIGIQTAIEARTGFKFSDITDSWDFSKCFDVYKKDKELQEAVAAVVEEETATSKQRTKAFDSLKLFSSSTETGKKRSLESSVLEINEQGKIVPRPQLLVLEDEDEEEHETDDGYKVVEESRIKATQWKAGFADRLRLSLLKVPDEDVSEIFAAVWEARERASERREQRKKKRVEVGTSTCDFSIAIN